MNGPELSVVGNLAGDPELRFTAAGRPVANFTVCQTPRFFDKTANEWRDGDTIFMRCSIWGDYAEHVAASLHRGDRVVVLGRLKSRSWETPEGDKRTVIEMDADEVGPALRFAEVRITRAQRSTTPDGGAPDDPWTPSSGAPSPLSVAG